MQTGALSGLTLLVVEDEAFLRRQVTTFLERIGADVTAVDTISKARTVAGDVSFDFALIDVNLPDGTGLDLLKDKVFPQNTGVIVMTAEGGVDVAVQAMHLGALDFLTKPFDLAEL